jgi:fatty acid desaturase
MEVVRAESDGCQVAGLHSVRQELREFLGAEELARLERPSMAFDVLASVVPFLIVFLGFWVVGLEGVGWLEKGALAVAIGWAATATNVVAHDLVVHRRRWGTFGSWLLGACAFALVSNRLTAYTIAHVRHHARINTLDDTEAYKQDIDTVAKRFAFCTVFGFKAATGGRWATPRRSGYFALIPRNKVEVARLRTESFVAHALVLFMIIYSWFDPVRVLMGWAVPLLLVAPTLNCLRVAIEHAEVDSSNPFWLATNYRSGLVSQFIFVCGAGDCHIVHHAFPKIPFYRCPRAARLLQPLLKEKGVVERRSFWFMMKCWFVDGAAHGTVWARR